MIESLWQTLLPCLAALLEANQKAGVRAVLASRYKIGEHEGDVGQFVFRLGDETGPLRPLPIEGKYSDVDGHAVFLSAHSDATGQLCEVELSRLNLQPIQRWPTVDDLEFSPVEVGAYEAVRPRR